MTQKIPLFNNSSFALVDDVDYAFLMQWRWRRNNKGCAVRSEVINGKRVVINMHRVIMNAQRGQYVDHINNDRLNNTRANLRLCTQSQNQANRRRHKNNTSGYKCVTRRGSRFQSRATPQEVESLFDQDLIFIPGRGGQMLAFIDKTLRGRLKRARAKGRSVATVQARFDKLVLMFVMVRQVTLRKRLEWPRIFDDLAKGWAQLFPAEIAAALKAGSN